MSLFESIDDYCERLSPDILAEPLNAITNISFFIASIFLARSYKKNNLADKPIAFLIIMVSVVGVGSGLFHTFANQLTMLADVIPILIIVLTYLFFAQVYLLKFSRTKSAAGLGILLLASFATGFIPPELRFNGSVSYFPCLAALLFLGWKSANNQLYLASTVFLFSLTFRSIDMMVCEELAIGTHFIWHLLNGVLLYLLVKILINDCAADRRV